MRLDLLHLARSIRRSPASAAAAILTLALTIGTGASIFAVVDAVLLTPPPFANPDALVLVGEAPIDNPAPARRPVRFATFEAWRERAGAVAELEAVDGTNLNVTGLGAAERVSANDVTPGFLALLGVAPALGRTFGADDIGTPVAIISHGFWRTKLGADPAVIGRPIVLGGRAHTIVGVLPEQFVFAFNRCDIWRPLPLTRAQAVGSGYRVLAMARLAAHASPSDLEVTLDEVSRASTPPSRAVATPVRQAIARDATRTLALLAVAAALAVIIAFTNLAGLLIVRSIDRRRELAVRNALGARPSEIARQLFLEGAALVVTGTVFGILLALWLTPAVGDLALERFGAIANRDVVLSWRVIGGAAALALVCAAVCGLLPALAASRWSVIEVLRRGTTPSPREARLRRVLVAGEVALAFVLLVSMALVGRTLLRVLAVNPGFDVRGVLALQISLPAADYPGPDRVASFYLTLQNALEERLGPHTVSIVDERPLTHDRGRSPISTRRAEAGPEAVVRTVSAGYFDVMRIPVIAGRSFDHTDTPAASPRVVISQSLAQKLFGSTVAVGRQIFLAPTSQTADIVGVVGDIKHRALDEVLLPTVYLSALQAPSPSSVVVVRTARPDADVIAVVREEVARLDGSLPVYGVRSLADAVAASPGVAARRLLTAALTGFAVLAVLLSAIGLFGVAAHDMACRRTELALRIALGADPAQMLVATLRQGARIVASGLAVGGLLSLWAVRALSGVIYAPERFDVVSIAAAAGLLMAAGAAAVFPAALRAARTDPLIALRSE